MNKNFPTIKIIKIALAGISGILALLFIPAGTLNYWQAWILCSVLFIPMIFIISYFIKHDPELLKRRMMYKEKEMKQKKIVKISTALLLIAFIIPGLDFRFGWSKVPFWLVIIANAFVLISYIIFFFVLKQNSYASRTIQVEKNQKLISTGLYAVVRHPMYFSILLMYLFIPFALGSYWAFIPSIFLPVFFIFRILNEEQVLKKDLTGYKEYCQKVKWRLIPWIW
jgi:protein-S-isoprenylcysteine O-methyltransferase Ste14